VQLHVLNQILPHFQCQLPLSDLFGQVEYVGCRCGKMVFTEVGHRPLNAVVRL
jgi:hypothetical protein